MVVKVGAAKQNSKRQVTDSQHLMHQLAVLPWRRPRAAVRASIGAWLSTVQRRPRRPGLLPLMVILASAVAVAIVWRHGCRQRPVRVESSSSYDSYIRAAAGRHGIAPALVKAVIWKESRFNASAVGTSGEVGLMQITDGAVTDWQRHLARPMPSRAARFDPGLNIEIGTWYLARAMHRWRAYRSADILALAQYNAGGSKAREWAPDDPQRPVRLEEIRFPSTRDYIRQVRAKWHEFEKEHFPSG